LDYYREFYQKFLEKRQKYQRPDSFVFTKIIGGSNWDKASKVIFDSQSNMIVCGLTQSLDFFPISNNSFQAENAGDVDFFLLKTNSEGIVIFSTYFGGDSEEENLDIAIDSNDNIILTGTSNSENFPQQDYPHTFNLAYDTPNAFISKFYPNGTLDWSTLFGGSHYDISNGIVLDQEDNIIISGSTESDDFPTLNGSFPNKIGLDYYDSFLTKFNPNGSIIWSTYFGGSENDYSQKYCLGIDSMNNIIIAGTSSSSDFPIKDGITALTTTVNSVYSDIFLAKWNSDGELLMSSHFGGNGWDDSLGLTIDQDNNIYISGSTDSSDFPTTALSTSKKLYEGDDCFISKLSPHGNLLWSSFIGGSKEETACSVTMISNSFLAVIGDTLSTDFPTTNNSFQRVLNKNILQNDNTELTKDIYLALVSPLNGTILFSSYIGGQNDDSVLENEVTVDSLGNFFIAGGTDSLDFPRHEDGGINGTFNSFYSYVQNPLSDIDKDFIPDFWEDLMGLNKTYEYDALLDKDIDSLNNLLEYQLYSNASNLDTDYDLMPDYWEFQMGLDLIDEKDASLDQENDDLVNILEFINDCDPKNPDTDRDQMFDGWEVKNFFDPLDNQDANYDPDDDDLLNWQEFYRNTDPYNSDSDDDGLPDGWEVEYTLDPMDFKDASQDNDNDGLLNFDEFIEVTDPSNPDSDDDGIPDGWEVKHRLDPRNPSDALDDEDNDFLANSLEYKIGFNPRNSIDAFLLYVFICFLIAIFTLLVVFIAKSNKKAREEGYSSVIEKRNIKKSGFKSIEEYEETKSLGFKTKEVKNLFKASGNNSVKEAIEKWNKLLNSTERLLEEKIFIEIDDKLNSLTNPEFLETNIEDYEEKINILNEFTQNLSQSLAFLKLLEKKIVDSKKLPISLITVGDIEGYINRTNNSLELINKYKKSIEEVLFKKNEIEKRSYRLLELIQITEDQKPISLSKIAEIIDFSEENTEPLLLLLLEKDPLIGTYDDEMKVYTKGQDLYVLLRDYIQDAREKLGDDLL
jgi:hypothetical protein